MPLFISLIRSDFTDVVLGSTASQALSPLKVHVADPSGPDASGYSLYSDSTCTSPVHPAGSTASSAGSDIAAPSAGSSFYKVYIKPSSTATYGQRRLEFFYDGSSVGIFSFDLTDALH
jgi:hypothetical protein